MQESLHGGTWQSPADGTNLPIIGGSVIYSNYWKDLGGSKLFFRFNVRMGE